MRRGLISRSLAELPDAVLDARLARVRAAMGDLDALIVYTNNTRAAGVSWLTGFVPYWSEALLVLPREREPMLVVALTYRVKSWIERTSRVAEVVHTPRIGLEAARMLAGWKADAAVGIVDFAGLPAGSEGGFDRAPGAGMRAGECERAGRDRRRDRGGGACAGRRRDLCRRRAGSCARSSPAAHRGSGCAGQ